jgi:hypothetical protein
VCSEGAIELARGGVEVTDDLLGAGVSSNSLVANLLAKGVGPGANARDQGRVWFMSWDDILEELLSLINVGRDVNPNCMDTGTSYTVSVTTGGEEAANNERLDGREQQRGDVSGLVPVGEFTNGVSLSSKVVSTRHVGDTLDTPCRLTEALEGSSTPSSRSRSA